MSVADHHSTESMQHSVPRQPSDKILVARKNCKDQADQNLTYIKSLCRQTLRAGPALLAHCFATRVGSKFEGLVEWPKVHLLSDAPLD